MTAVAMTAENRKQRLRRLELIYLHSPKYFITACTYNRQKILATHTVHESFLRFAHQGPNYGAWIGGYVLMPDHVHAIVAIDDQRLNLSAWGKSFKNSISKTLRQNGIASPHWEKTFFDHLLRSAESYTQKMALRSGQSCTSRTCKQVGGLAVRGRSFPAGIPL